MKDPEKNGNDSFIILMLFIINFYCILLVSELRSIIIIIALNSPSFQGCKQTPYKEHLQQETTKNLRCHQCEVCER